MPPDILQALLESNLIQHAPYGSDTYSEKAKAGIQAHLRKVRADIHFVASGTMANIVAIASCLRPHEAVIAVGSVIRLVTSWATEERHVDAISGSSTTGQKKARQPVGCGHEGTSGLGIPSW